MPDPDLSGRTALVTGSAGGLGRAIVLALAEAGASVAVHYRTSEADAEATREAAEAAGAPAATTVRADVTVPGDVDAAFEAVEADLGPVEVLVNNVGPFAPEHWASMSIETWQAVVDGNLRSTYLCCRRGLPGMREAGWGRIVNIGYAGADRALVTPKNAPYFLAKTAVTMFTRVLAADTVDEDVTANVVAPYVVENSDATPDDLPMGRPARFEEVVAAVLFFLGPDVGYVSGQHLAVDGGRLPERV